jgi:hypothetical protein
MLLGLNVSAAVFGSCEQFAKFLQRSINTVLGTKQTLNVFQETLSDLCKDGRR